MWRSKEEYDRCKENLSKMTDYGYKDIASKILFDAISESRWKNVTPELSKFFNSDWCNYLLQICGYDITGAEVLEIIRTGANDEFLRKKQAELTADEVRKVRELAGKIGVSKTAKLMNMSYNRTLGIVKGLYYKWVK